MPTSQDLDRPTSHPFTTKPLLPLGFRGRDDERDIVHQRVELAESAVIVSELPNGRTSLLRRLEHELRAAGRRTHREDLELLPDGARPADLWARLERSTGLALAAGALPDEPVQGPPPVLLLDDLHAILERPHLLSNEFLGTLRALTISRALAVVATSSVDLDVLWRRILERGRTGGPCCVFGSPYFNGMRSIVLGPLDERDADAMLVAVADLDPDDRALILRCSGAQPRLLQSLASLLYYFVRRRPDPHHVHRDRALRACRDELGPVFELAWRRLSARERWGLAVVCAADVAGLDIPGGLDTRAVESASVPALAQWSDVLRHFESHVSRAELQHALQDRFGRRVIQQLPPDAAPDAAFFAAATDLLVRHGRVEELLTNLRPLAGPPPRASHWPGGRTASDSDLGLFSTIQRLEARGLLTAIEEPPGWELRPKLLEWWIVDHLCALPVSATTHGWLQSFINDELGEVSLIEGRILRKFVQDHWDEFRRGPAPLIAQVLR